MRQTTQDDAGSSPGSGDDDGANGNCGANNDSGIRVPQEAQQLATPA